jgi:hypothetical protein
LTDPLRARIVGHNEGVRGVNVTDQETRKRLLINRHIAKMTPEEIARRFIVAYTAPVAVIKRRPTQNQAKATS